VVVARVSLVEAALIALVLLVVVVGGAIALRNRRPPSA
jgi:hypothetical protein